MMRSGDAALVALALLVVQLSFDLPPVLHVVLIAVQVLMVVRSVQAWWASRRHARSRR